MCAHLLGAGTHTYIMQKKKVFLSSVLEDDQGLFSGKDSRVQLDGLSALTP